MIGESHFKKNHRFVFWSPLEEPSVSYLCPFPCGYDDESNEKIHTRVSSILNSDFQP
jgi:hypothetical protein